MNMAFSKNIMTNYDFSTEAKLDLFRSKIREFLDVINGYIKLKHGILMHIR